jgi:hypothetical protein
MFMRSVFAAAVMAVLCVSAAAAEEDCRLTLAASLPMLPGVPGRVAIPAGFAGKDGTLLIDTGSPISGLAPSGAARLGLEPHVITSDARLRFPYAGGDVTHYVKFKEFKLGDMTAPTGQFIIMPLDTRETDGLIGADFLRQFDVEFDFANGKVNLFQPHPCKGKVVYWTNTAPVATVPVHNTANDPHLRVELKLDGKTVPAIIDTGAPVTSLSDQAAHDWFNVDENTPGVRKLNANRLRYKFGALSFEGVMVQSPEININHSVTTEKPTYEVLVGYDVLRHFHMYLSYKERMLYLTEATAH